MTIGPGDDESGVMEVILVCYSVGAALLFFSYLKKPASVSMEENIFAVTPLAAVMLPRIFPYAAWFTTLLLYGGDFSSA